MTLDWKGRTSAALGADVVSASPLAVGFGLSGYKAKLSDGRLVAVKARGQPAGRKPGLSVEAFMLRELAKQSDLPLPQVFYGDDDLLVMDWIATDNGGIGKTVQYHAAELLVALHSKNFEYFGYRRDTVIGPLEQPNAPSQNWIDFFRDQRLMHMARLACDEGSLPPKLLLRIESLAGRLDRYLIEPAHPSLLHGDLWTGNILVKDGHVAGVIDPAIYYGDREIELAFTTMFGTFGHFFFDAYHALAALQPGFHEVRCGIYNLYPTLVHVRLFGASYLPQIETTLSKLGL